MAYLFLIWSNKMTAVTDCFNKVVLCLSIILLLASFETSAAIWRYKPTAEFIERAIGESLVLSCAVDDHYDSCDWAHLESGIRCGVKYTWVWDYLQAHYKAKKKSSMKSSCNNIFIY